MLNITCKECMESLSALSIFRHKVSKCQNRLLNQKSYLNGAAAKRLPRIRASFPRLRSNPNAFIRAPATQIKRLFACAPNVANTFVPTVRSRCQDADIVNRASRTTTDYAKHSNANFLPHASSFPKKKSQPAMPPSISRSFQAPS